jgi:hypothetical protein
MPTVEKSYSAQFQLTKLDFNLFSIELLIVGRCIHSSSAETFRFTTKPNHHILAVKSYNITRRLTNTIMIWSVGEPYNSNILPF